MNKTLNITPIKIYEDIYNNKNTIYQDNKNKTGVYKWVNKINKKSYIGSSINLSNRFKTYFCMKGLNRILKYEKSHIYSAIIKYDYSCFVLEILEYCDKDVVIEREQYYIDNLNPEYNIMKVAKSCLGYTHNIRNRISISIASRKRAVTHKKVPDTIITKTTTTTRIMEKKTKTLLSLRSQGMTVKLFDRSRNFIKEFNSMQDTAKYLGLHVSTVKSVYDRGFSYDDYIYEFKPKDNRVWIYNKNYKLEDVLKDAKTVCNKYSIPSSTISAYMNTNKLYKNKFYFYNSYKK